MAARGPKPKNTVVRLVTGNAGHRPLPDAEPEADGRPVKPARLRGRSSTLWDEAVKRAPWLAAADSYKLHVWVALQAEFEKAPTRMVASRIAQLRALGSELGFDPSSRTRIGKGDGGKKADPADKYF